jgi:hypothetical protein
MTEKILKSARMVFTALAFCLFLSGFAFAQGDTSATLTGRVTDSTGAVVPNATILVVNTRTRLERQVQANESGVYTVFPLEPGEYTVNVEQTGFKRSVISITLSVQDRRSVDIVLEVGTPTETVTVTDEPPLIQDSPVGQTLVSGNQITELPLNNRNFIRLLETIPGVSSDLDDEANFGLTSRASISINGMRRNAVNYLVDGVSNVDVGSNITLLSTPTVDSIREFKVLSSNYTAEIGRSGGGAVIIVTRGGGNDFRGTLYEFTRNDYFNANSFFNNRLGRNADGTPRAPVPKLRYHNFGGTISGPVYLPRFGEGGSPVYSGKNRTFFFFSEEVRRIRRATTNANATVPTAAQRQGDFSAQLGVPVCRTAAGVFTTNCTAAGNTPVMATDTSGNVIQIRSGQIFRPSDNSPYANNVIPTSEIDPRALGLLAAYPLPNNGVNGFTSSLLNINNTRQEVFRIDHNFNPSHKIFGRYTRDLSQTQESGGLFTGIVLPNLATTDTTVPGQVLAISYTGIFSSNVVNEFSFNYSMNEISSVLVGRGRRTDYANAGLIQEYFPENNNNAIPSIAGTGFSTIGSLQGYSIEYANTGFRDTLTWNRGNHILKFGTEMTWEIKNENAGSNSQGSFGFSVLQSRGFVGATPITGTGVVTGNAFASFLLGRANTYSEAETDFRVNFRFGRREFFVQDTWKIRPNLTLDLGVRYQYFVPPFDKNDRIGSFDPWLYNRSQTICANVACTALTPASNRNNGFGLANSTSRFGRSIVPRDLNNFSPRVGIAWDPFKDGKTVVRAGYGFYYDQVLVGIFEQAAFTTPAFNANVSFTSTTTSVITFDNPGAGAPPGTLPLVSTIAMAPDFKTPETQQMSIGVQRQVFRNAVVDVSYVRTKGDNLLRRRNINFVTPAQTVAVGAANVNAFRPYVGLGAITYAETSAKSRYNGLLSSFNYRLPKGFTITLAYTFSKAMTDSTNDRDAVDDPQNPFDTSTEYAEARTSRPHIFSASYVYEIPFFRNAENTALRLLLGGWQVSGITNIESGAPVPRVTVADTLSGQRGSYPNTNGDPQSGLAGTTDPVTGLPFIFDPTAFEPAATGQFGNATRSFARLPGRNQTNLALMKQFYFNRERTRYLQFRAESFNLFNQTQFIGINTILPSAGPLSNTTFGRPTATRLPREFQFGLKLYF